MDYIGVPCEMPEDAYPPSSLGCGCIHPGTQAFLKAAF